MRDDRFLDENYDPKLEKTPGTYISDIVFLMQCLGYGCDPINYVDVFNTRLTKEERRAIIQAINSN